MADQTPETRHETTTVIVSVDQTLDEDAQIARINQQVGEGWRVVQKVPLSGGGAGPGGESEHFLRMQVTLQREIGPDNVPNPDFDPMQRGEDAGGQGGRDAGADG